MHRRIFLGMAILAGLAGSMAYAEEWNKNYTVSGQPQLTVLTDDGSVTVRGWDQHNIAARVITTGWRIAPGEVSIRENQMGDRVDLEVKLPRQSGWNWGGFHNRSIKVELQVPHELMANIKTGDGSINLGGVRGGLRLNTGDGAIEADNIGGTLEAHTGDGHVRVRGRFDALNVNTGDGGVDIDVEHGSRIQSTSWKVSTGDGGVRVNLPGDFAADLDVRTGDGGINMDVPLMVSSGALKENHVRGKLNGGGGTLTVTTGDGGIHIGRS